VKKGNVKVKQNNGKQVVNRNIPMYSYWKGKKLSYLEARREIYCPLYAELAKKTKAWRELKELYDSGVKIQILGYDGYDYTCKTLKECFLDQTRPFGHVRSVFVVANCF
jgi:hypothetical protein